ncbi:hypothetical protein ACIP5Y_40720 [Nocardia sp. NPDC088792]|uniref:hypothetical protein n=1 Tax=Nocardia sp. NPDC088792 TaxID=3364332 RepID=UPI00381B527B
MNTENPFAFEGLPGFAGVSDPAPTGRHARVDDESRSNGIASRGRHHTDYDDYFEEPVDIVDRSWTNLPIVKSVPPEEEAERARPFLPGDPDEQAAVYGPPIRAVDPVIGTDATDVEVRTATALGRTTRVGAWDEWLARPRRPGDYDDEEEHDGAHGETWGDVARRGFVDRTGGRTLLDRLRRTEDDFDDEPGPGRSRGASIVLGVLAVAAVLIVAILVISVNAGMGKNKTGHPAMAVPTPAPAPAPTLAGTPEPYPHATADCLGTHTDALTVGAGPGDPTTGPGAILGFEWSYYVDRNAARAREFVAPDGTVSDTKTIQSGIDSVPADTRYCVHITGADHDPNTWNVVLSEQFPTDKTPRQWPQTVTTRTDHGRVLITGIRAN